MKTKVLFTALALTFLSWSVIAFSQDVRPEKTITPVGFDILTSLSDVAPVPPGYVDQTWKEKVIPNKDGFLEEFKTEAAWKGPDPVLQGSTRALTSTATIVKNFNGMANTSGVAPPDTDGDVSADYYMQMVNLSLQVFDKNGNSLYGPVASSVLWNGFTGPWTGTNDGDPIVLYDQYADRWIATQFSLPNYPSGPFYQLIAVSATNNPTGSWYRYAYEFANMPDYPKFGVWPDGYYFTINQFAPRSLGFAGAGVCVLNRTAMIAGSPTAQMLFFNLGTAYGSLLPADADGLNLPPSSSPNYLANLETNSLRIWKATIDWNTTSNSTVSLLTTLATQAYSYSGISITQPGTTQTLDALASRLMYRLQYRNFGSYEVMLTNHTVNANGTGQAGVRWYELRKTGSGPWSIYQQGTYAPADGNSRWMASIAMNGNGDIGLGYSVSSGTTYPSIRCAGQTAANTGTGILDVSETSIHQGTASQTGVARWGDYSMMSVDPVDDATFWFTSEYSTGGWNWKTKIASFTVQPPVPVTPVANFSASPLSVIASQQVTFTDLSTNTPTSWSWSFPGGTPETSTSQNPVVTYSTPGVYSVTLTATNSAGSNTLTKTDYITVTDYVVTYCVSKGLNVSKEWINSMSLGSFVKTSGANGGYGDFTSPAISLVSGNSYSLALSPGFSSRSRSEYWRVWIDYNNDGDFLDNGETVFSSNAKTGNVSGTITIPAGLTTDTRMRVAMKYNAAPTSCEQFSFGEVEDYTLSIAVPVPQPPVADFSGTPLSLIVGGSVQFTDNSLNDPTSWSWNFYGGSPTVSSEQNPVVTYTSPGIYSVTLTATNGVGSDTKTISGYVTVNLPASYCESHSNSSATDWISKVTVSTFSNPSGASTYSDFTSLSIGMAPATTNSIVLTPNTTSRREYWSIWIDYNGDGDFADAGELAFSAANKKGNVTGSILVPASVSGETRMRVSMKSGSAPTSCEVFANGEVEDYTVIFTTGPTLVAPEKKLKLDIYPNPASNLLNIAVTGSGEKINIKVYNALGQIIDDFNAGNTLTMLDLSNFAKGIYYIGADDGVETTLRKFIKE